MLATRLVPLALAVVFASCSGGGAGGSGGGTTPSAPLAGPTPSGAAVPVLTGTAVDDATGRPIAGAVVYVSGGTAIAGATPLPATATPWPTVTTAADGSFDVTNVPASDWTVSFTYVGAGYPVYGNAQWIEIFSPDGHAAFHALRSIATTGTTNLGNIAIALPNAGDVAWLNQINTDRATLGVPRVSSPLVFDSVTLQTARYWAGQMESGNFFAHMCPAVPATCVEFWLYETQHGSVPSAQNISEQSASGSWLAAEAAFMAETANCPGANWQTCTYSETTGHYINIMEATNWAGVGMAQTLSAPAVQYYAENFSTPSGISTIESAILGPCAATSAPSSTSIPPQPRTKSEQRRYNSCASFPASRARRRPMRRHSSEQSTTSPPSPAN